MSLFKTPTPSYDGQNSESTRNQPDWLHWIKQLLKTPTPQYLRSPVHTAQVKWKLERAWILEPDSLEFKSLLAV